jgi:hypothetical protein
VSRRYGHPHCCYLTPNPGPLGLTFCQINASTVTCVERGVREPTRTHFRSVVTSLTLAAWLCITSTVHMCFAMVSSGGLQPWPSFSAIHAEMGRIDVRNAADAYRGFDLFMWWSVPISTALVFGFLFPTSGVLALASRLNKNDEQTSTLVSADGENMRPSRETAPSPTPTIK